MNEGIAVSIICNAYNHERYIKDALESFIMQKTNFSFEILVHDDASTDATANIIREYEGKYPDLIKPIYQKENQRSQGVSVGNIQLARVKGKYIALCEGDDYWIDPFKLQKQYDAMENHPELDICTHRAEKRAAKDNSFVGYIAPASENTLFSVEKVIEGGGGFVATNSIFYRSSINTNMPNYRKQCGYDFVTQMYGALRGGMLYLDDCMSVYRVGVSNSWISRTNSDREKIKKHYYFKKKIWEMIDEETGGKYTAAINRQLEKFAVSHCEILIPRKQLKKPPYVSEYKKLPLSRKIKIELKYLFPWVWNIKCSIAKIRKK